MLDSVAALTASVALPVMPPLVAVMVVVPAIRPVATPELLMEATVGVEEDQVTATEPVLPSEKVPVAVNDLVPPTAREALAGVMANESRVAGVTVAVVWADIPPEAAVMKALPTPKPVTRPIPLTVAMAGVLLVQVTLAVRSRLVPSE